MSLNSRCIELKIYILPIEFLLSASICLKKIFDSTFILLSLLDPFNLNLSKNYV